MHRAALIASLALVACSATREDLAPPQTLTAVTGTPAQLATGGPFAGVWQACEGAATPDECSRYVLVQRGDRICGTWEYIATGDGYAGRVVARAVSAVEARRTHVCGRPGSEARTECTAGWDRIDKPLRLCDGKLSDIDSADGACRADYARVAASPEAAELARDPWVQACLANGAEAAR